MLWIVAGVASLQAPILATVSSAKAAMLTSARVAAIALVTESIIEFGIIASIGADAGE